MKKQLCALLAALLLLAGCGSDGDGDEASTTATYSLAENNFQGEETILTIDGDPVSVTEYFYFLNLVVESVIGTTALDSVDWNTTYGDMTLSEYISALTLSQIKQYYAVRQYAEGMGFGLSEEQEAEIAGEYESLKQEFYDQYSDEATAEAVVEQYIPQDAVLFLLAYPHYMANLTEGLYGPDSGSAPTDEEVIDYMESAGYYRATYLYYAYDGRDSDEKLARALAVREELDAADDPLALLDDLIAAEGEDELLAEMAEGYYFTEADVDTGFFSIVSALEENEISQVVDGEDGCMIAARLPLEADAMRETCLQLMVQESILSLRTSATVVYSDIYAYANPRSYCYWVVYEAEDVG